MDFPHSQILRAFEQSGTAFEELSIAEHRDCVRQWVEEYGDFYSGERRRLRGVRAIAEAQRLSRGSFFLVPCRDPSIKGWSPVGIAYRCRSDQLPDLTEASHYVDVFISPVDFAWTLLYGHEVDVFGGPEFSYLDWRVPISIERARKRE